MMSHSPGLYIENAVNFPLNYADQCQAAAVEVVKLLSNLFPTANSKNATGRAGNTDNKGSTGYIATQRDELQNVGRDLRARDLRVEALQRALRQEVEARKETVRQQQQIISDINKSGHKLQLPAEAVAYIWTLFDEANRPAQEDGMPQRYWTSYWMDPLRKAFGRDYYPSSVYKFCADLVKEENLVTSDPARLHVTFYNASVAASNACPPLESALRFKERWNTLQLNVSPSNNHETLAIFQKCAPAWPYLEHIIFKPVEARKYTAMSFAGNHAPFSFRFSVAPHQVPRRLKSADLRIEYLVPLKAFIAGVSSLSLGTIESDLANFYLDIIPNLPRNLKSLKLSFEPSYEDDMDDEAEGDVPPPGPYMVQTPNLETLELVHFAGSSCSKILAPFERISLRRLILHPHHFHDFRDGIIERIDTLFPQLSFLGIVATGIVTPDSYTEEQDHDTPRSEKELFSFIGEAIALICGKPNQEPLLKHLRALELPFPSPCAFERIRQALEYRRSCPNVTRIDQLMLDCCLPSGTFYLHDYCSRFTESLQVIVKDVVLLNQEKCTECNYALAEGPKRMWH